ncbi:MAG: rhodanese-like domain-containing protein [Thiotrichaceae bacterium]|nr:rhodanese-like domain-containing protein [Thiotrichaceae bacterium]
MKVPHLLTVTALTAGVLLTTNVYAEDEPVGITRAISSVMVKHKGKDVKIERNQDNDNQVAPDFALTSRACPPFCIQPMSIDKGVETVGELEVIEYVKKMSGGDKQIILIDSRTPNWVAKGTIPSAVNVPWSKLVTKQGATTAGIMKLMTSQFGAKLKDEMAEIDVDEAIADGDTSTVFDFSKAKTLVLFCNGMWCGQSPESIKALIRFGYPKDKIKYYRGGMQSWEILGLSTVK